jgi:hypothetical protein
MSQPQPIPVPPPDELRRADVPRLIQELERLSDIVAERFVPLTAEQLNWKVDPTEWSIGQCLDHLITTDAQYIPIFEQTAQGTLRRNAWQQFPLLPRLFGDMLYNSTHPQTARSVPSPRIFRPTNNPVEPDVCEQFQAHQQQIIDLMRANQDQPIDERIISSPVAVWMVYSLGDAFRLTVVHQYLHLAQAERVRHATDFPPSSAAPDRSAQNSGE